MEKSQSPESSAEFEFWSSPQPQHFLTADELFADGIILPLTHPPSSSSSSSDPNPNITSSLPPPPTSSSNTSKTWKQIFTSRNKFTTTAHIASSSAELNIHIWPFSRSRSAGNAAISAARPRTASGRKSCSAPCSRSNSRGESTAPKKWGPLAGGIHVGRSMPVWQLKRSSAAKTSTSATVGMLTLKVNTCIGYGSQVRTCRGEDNDEVTGGDQSGGRNGSMFNLRAIFSKKVY